MSVVVRTVLLALLLAVPCHATEVPSAKIAVFDLKTIGDTPELGKGAAEILRTALLETHNYVVVDHSVVDDVLKKQNPETSFIEDASVAAGIGKNLDVQIVCIGNVVKLGESYTINVWFIDANAGVILSGNSLTTKQKESIPALCRQLIQMFIEKENSGAWALGGLYPGASIKYFATAKSAWELRAQATSGIFAAGPRYYHYFSLTATPRLFWGLEADSITYKGKVSKSIGFAGGGFVGGEVFLTKEISLLMDFGPMLINLSDNKHSESASVVEYIVNFSVYWHL